MILFTALLTATYAATILDEPSQAQKLFAQNGRGLDKFGAAIDMEGTRIAIGGDVNDQAWVFELGPDLWHEDANIKSPDPIGGDSFGADVALSGDTLLVGAHRDSNENGAMAGSAYVFVRVGGNWVLQQRLLPSAGGPGDCTGFRVALEGDTAVLASFVSPNAYVFTRTNTTWTEDQVITVPDGGWALSVALEGSTLLVGSPNAMSRGPTIRGACYVYEKGGAAWGLQQTLLPSGVPSTGEFGFAVALDGASLVSTARNEDVSGSHRGAAYVFRDSGNGWLQEAHLIAPNGETDNNFGWFADLEGDRLVVSEVLTPGPSNSSYLFKRTGTTWGPGLEIVPAPIGCNQVGCRNPPVLEDPYLVIGADNDTGVGPLTGAVYVYLFPEDPVTYCTGKVNSQGCTPQIAWSGQPTMTGPDDFVVSATEVLPGKNGIFFFGVNGTGVFPFLGGTLCSNPPLKRSFVQQATMGAGCSGSISYLFSQADMSVTGLDPGEFAHGQFWLRDPNHPDGFGTSLSNAIEVQIQP